MYRLITEEESQKIRDLMPFFGYKQKKLSQLLGLKTSQVLNKKLRGKRGFSKKEFSLLYILFGRRPEVEFLRNYSNSSEEHSDGYKQFEAEVSKLRETYRALLEKNEFENAFEIIMDLETLIHIHLNGKERK